MDGVLATPAAVDHDFDELKSLYDIAFSLDSRPYHVFGKVDSASTYGTLLEENCWIRQSSAVVDLPSQVY